LRLYVNTHHDNAHTNHEEERIKVIDPTHPLYNQSFVVNKKGLRRIFVNCNGTQVSIALSSTDIGYIKNNWTSKLDYNSVNDLVLLAKKIGEL